MRGRRTVLLGAAGLVTAGGGYATGAFRKARLQARTRLFGQATGFYSIGAMLRQHSHWFRQDLATLFDMLAGGRFDPTVAEVMPLAEPGRAQERVEAGEVAGKLVMRVADR